MSREECGRSGSCPGELDGIWNRENVSCAGLVRFAFISEFGQSRRLLRFSVALVTLGCDGYFVPPLYNLKRVVLYTFLFYLCWKGLYSPMYRYN